MSFTFPPLRVTFDGQEPVVVQVRRVDLLRLERAEKISTARMDLGLDQLHKLAWLALQRDRHPAVGPHHDLAQVSVGMLCAGADALAESADVEVVDEVGEVGKASGPAPLTGTS
jgi:hypothetical protein